jgi:hypothetical protein
MGLAIEVYIQYTTFGFSPHIGIAKRLSASYDQNDFSIAIPFQTE